MPSSPPIVVITGASAGVGRAAAIAFARDGWDVALIARGEEDLAGAAADVEAAGGRAMPIPADVADADAIDAAADRVEREWGEILVWVNAAMATVFSPFTEMAADEFRRVTEVTYLGQVHGTMAALRHMKPRDRGTVVQVGSALSYRAIPLQTAYCGAKAAVRVFTDGLRAELIHDGSRVRLTMVQLPGLNTPQFNWSRVKLRSRPQPVPPIYAPEVGGRAVLHAAYQAPRELWVGKSSLQTILGQFVAPHLLDRMLSKQAYEGQMTEEPNPRPTEGNLFEPVGREEGVRGPFTDRAEDKAIMVEESTVRLGLLGAGLGVAAAAMGVAFWAGRKAAGR